MLDRAHVTFMQRLRLEKELEQKYKDIQGNPEKIETAIETIEKHIKNAQEGGCIRRPSIMGPSPELEKIYRDEKMFLEIMLAEAKKQINSNQPKR